MAKPNKTVQRFRRKNPLPYNPAPADEKFRKALETAQCEGKTPDEQATILKRELERQDTSTKQRVTLNKVNAEIARRGGHAQLVHNRTKEYFYFINVGPRRVPSSSIPVSRLGVYTLDQWISEWERVEREEGQ